MAPRRYFGELTNTVGIQNSVLFGKKVCATSVDHHKCTPHLPIISKTLTQTFVFFCVLRARYRDLSKNFI